MRERGDAKNMERGGRIREGKIDSYCDGEILFSIIYRPRFGNRITQKIDLDFDSM